MRRGLGVDEHRDARPFVRPPARFRPRRVDRHSESDGRNAHLIRKATGLGGWSSDGQFILVRWKPPDNKLGGLGTLRPDGSDLTILVPFDESTPRRLE